MLSRLGCPNLRRATGLAAAQLSKTPIDKIKADLAAIWFLSKISGREPEAAARCDSVIEEHGLTDDVDLMPYVAAAMSNRGWLLAWHQNDVPAAMEAFEGVVQKYAAIDDPEVRAKIYGATVNRGWLLFEIGQIEKSIELFDEVISNEFNSDNEFILPQLSNAMVNKAYALFKLDRNRLEEAKGLCVDVIARFGNSADRQFHESVAEAKAFLMEY